MKKINLIQKQIILFNFILESYKIGNYDLIGLNIQQFKNVFKLIFNKIYDRDIYKILSIIKSYTWINNYDNKLKVEFKYLYKNDRDVKHGFYYIKLEYIKKWLQKLNKKQ